MRFSGVQILTFLGLNVTSNCLLTQQGGGGTSVGVSRPLVQRRLVVVFEGQGEPAPTLVPLPS